MTLCSFSWILWLTPIFSNTLHYYHNMLCICRSLQCNSTEMSEERNEQVVRNQGQNEGNTVPPVSLPEFGTTTYGKLTKATPICSGVGHLWVKLALFVTCPQHYTLTMLNSRSAIVRVTSPMVL